MNRLWTEAEDNIIRADSAARIPRPVTAAKLGRPVHATRNRALKLNQQIQVHIAWTADEEAALRGALTQEVPAPTDNDLSRRFGRKISSLRAKIKELGLAGPRRHRRDRGGRDRGASSERARLRQSEKAEARARRAAERLAQIAEKAAAQAERHRAREEARVARETARIVAAEARKVARLAAQAARAATKPKREAQSKPLLPKPMAKPQPKPPVHDPQAAMARMRDAWRRVSTAPRQASRDPAEAERRLLAMLGTR
jgi:hypothetical protein